MRADVLQSVSAHRRRRDERSLRYQISALLSLHLIRHSGFAGDRRLR